MKITNYKFKLFVCIITIISLVTTSFAYSFDSYMVDAKPFMKYMNPDVAKQLDNYEDAQRVIYENVANSRTNEIWGPFVVNFGQYPQEGTNFMVKDPIEWFLLHKVGNRALLISRDVLDIRQMVEDEDAAKNYTWETSDLRKWLNGYFYDNAFGKHHKRYIATNSQLNDKVFVLSSRELHSYFGLEKLNYHWGGVDERGWSYYGKKYYGNPYVGARFTTYACRDLFIDEKPEYFWLRDGLVSVNGVLQDQETKKISGLKKLSPKSITNQEHGVRPCIWIDFNRFAPSVIEDKKKGNKIGDKIAKEIIGSYIPFSGLFMD